jgi:hypothetical protein
MSRAGFKQVNPVLGGFQALIDAGMPVAEE